MLSAVAVALFGLLSMHGWGSHTPGHTMATAPAANAAAVAPGHAADHRMPTTHDRASVADGDDSPGAVSPGDREKPGGDPGTGLLGLCLAVLCALLLGIALLLARRGLRIPRWQLPTCQHAVFIGRDRDPPDLLQLCVIRC